MNEVKELLARTVFEQINSKASGNSIAEAILNLKRQCPKCEGSGRSKKVNHEMAGKPYELCPTCNGTGEGGKMLFTKEDIYEQLMQAKKSGWDDCERWHKAVVPEEAQK